MSSAMGFHAALLRRALSRTPDHVQVSLLCGVFNRCLIDALARKRLAEFSGRRVCLVIDDADSRWSLLIHPRGLRADAGEGAADIRIQGSLAAFISLATRSEDADTLFFRGRLRLDGDAQTGVGIKNLLDSLAFDPQQWVQAVVGERLAQRMAPSLRRWHNSPVARKLQSRALHWIHTRFT